MMTTLRRHLPFLLAILFLAISAGTGWAQEEGHDEHSGKTLVQVIIEGGPLVISVWVAILGTSIVMVTLIIQNIMTLQPNKLAPPPLVESLRQLITNGNYQEAWETCNQNAKVYLASIMRAGLSRIGRGKETAETGMLEHAVREATLLRTRNSYLSVIGVVSPMIGLLGTVIGMVGAFAVLGQSGVSNPRELAAKIGEVLYATASGLFIAIPAFVAYYIFRNAAQQCLVHADDIANQLMLDIPYDELSGVRIGENFSAGVVAMGGARKVSMALTTNCPVCSGPVTPGVNPCPHCGATLDWAA